MRSMAESKAVNVHQSKDFDRMTAPSELTKSLKRQGYLGLLVKKGKAKNYEGNENNENDVESDDGHDDLEERSNARKNARSSKL